MSFPYIFHSNFEAGTAAEWDSETDTETQLDFPHYTELARYPWPTALPSEGAYCARWVLAGGTADAILTEADIDIAANTERWFAFDLWFSPTFTGTANDTVHLLELVSTGPVIEAVMGFRVVAATNVINLGIGELAPTSFSAEAIERGVWYTVELKVDLDNAGSNDGTIDMYVTRRGEPFAGSVAATQVGSLDQAAVTDGMLGVQNHLATTTGVILIDRFIMDDTRVYPQQELYEETLLLTKTGHAFVGPGTIESITLLSGNGTDCVVSVYDSDKAETNDASLKWHVANTAANEIVETGVREVNLTRGAYVTLTGTTPRALISTKNVKCMSDALVRYQGLNRTLGN